MNNIYAPMPAKVVEVKVVPGDKVIKDETIIVIEAMKMEMPILMEEAGVVKEVCCAVGDAVKAKDVLAIYE